jgi:hypothetical protein
MTFGLSPVLGRRAGQQNPYEPPTPLDQNEVLANQLLAAMAERTLGAQSAATEASSAYSSAAAAPQPNVFNERPVQTAGAMGLSRIAEGLGRAEAPAQVRQTIGDQQKALSARRVENLKALQTHYDSLAERAAKVGDLEQAAKQKALSDRAAREQAKLLEQTRQTGQNERTAATIAAADQRSAATIGAANTRARLGRESSERIASMRTGTGLKTPEFAAKVKTFSDGLANNQIQMAQVPREMRGAVLEDMAATGRKIIPNNTRMALKEIEASIGVINRLRYLSDKVNTAKKGLMGRGTEVKRRWEIFTRTNPDAIAYERERKAFAGNLARAGSADKGTLNEGDIQRAIGFTMPVGSEAEISKKQLDDAEAFLRERHASGIRLGSSADVSLPAAQSQSQTAAPTAPGATGGLVHMIGDDGSDLYVPADEVGDAEAEGASRADD